jgi:hypothetical protein
VRGEDVMFSVTEMRDFTLFSMPQSKNQSGSYP